LGREENVELVRRWFARAAEGDPATDHWHPQCVIENAEGWVIEASYTGREGMQHWWDELAEAFSEFRLVLESAEAVDDERVLTTQRAIGRFRATGIAGDMPWAGILTVREGLLIHAIGFFTESQARDAAGLGAEVADEA
jgi:ketosteroid isomerase-like protein